MLDIITTMLGDNSTFTIGSVLMAFNQVCPDRLDLIHPQFRKLCRMLVDMDEWGQITALDLLLRYSRYVFRPKRRQLIRVFLVEWQLTK